MPEKPDDAAEQRAIQQAIDSSPIKIYANGFTTITSAGDVALILLLNGKSVATINISYTVAKTLGAGLAKAIADVEDATGQKIMTVNYVSGKIAEANARAQSENG